MKRTFSAIIIAALSGTFAGPPAFSQTSSDQTYAGFEPQLRLDIGSVVLVGQDSSADGDVLFDLDAELELENFTAAGRRWGFVVGGRIEHDPGRRAWGGQAGDCAPGTADCASLSVAGISRPVRGATSGFQSAVAERSDSIRLALQSAYGFLDIGWGELRLGYGAGAADLDAEQGPSAFRLSRADGGRVDLTGLSGARTRNLSSGTSPKLVFRSIALGQTSSIGALRASASFTPEVRDCGVDHCAWGDGPGGLLGPAFENVWEVGARYEIRRGEHEIAVSLGFSEGGDATGYPGFTGISSRDAGISWTRGDFSAGARWFRSNNGIAANGDYEAWSVSAGLERGPWLTTLEWARFSDDLVHVDGETVQLSASRLIGEHWVLGGGIQAASRDDPVVRPSGREDIRLRGEAVFAELGWQF